MSHSSFSILIRHLAPRALRNALRSPRSTGKWIRAESASLLGIRSDITIRPDWRVRCHALSAASFSFVAKDEDSLAELDGFIRHCNDAAVVFDIGASHGLFTLAAIRYGGPKVKVVAVDPSSTSNRALRTNLKLSGAAERVIVVEAAVGSEDGSVSMLTTGPAGDYYFVVAPENRSDARQIPQISLGGLQKLAGAPPTHLKIDVEGYEAEIIHGGKDFLRSIQPLIFLELHSDMLRKRNYDPATVLNDLAECGYRKLERHGQTISAQAACKLPLSRLLCRNEAHV